jgi:hypothetical protein
MQLKQAMSKQAMSNQGMSKKNVGGHHAPWKRQTEHSTS